MANCRKCGAEMVTGATVCQACDWRQKPAKNEPPALRKICTCGKPSMFGANTPLNHCQACYLEHVHAAGKAQSPSKEIIYAAACRAGLGKRKDETLAEYALRCRHSLGSITRAAGRLVGGDKNRMAGTSEAIARTENNEPTTDYLEAHAEQMQ